MHQIRYVRKEGSDEFACFNFDVNKLHVFNYKRLIIEGFA